MEFVRVYFLPLALSLGAALLLGVETRAIQVELTRGAPRWLRFGRRMGGALIIAIVAFMLHFGSSLPAPGTNQETVYRQFNYWLIVLGLVLAAMVLAAWDAIDSVRTLKSHVETLERAEVELLQEELRKRRKS